MSGEAMSRALGISRAAVWKAIEALRQEGYEIQSAPKRGYRLERAPDRVGRGLAGPLAGCHVGSRLMCLDVIDSTNTEAKRQAMAGAPEGWSSSARSRPAAGGGWAAPSSHPGHGAVPLRPAPSPPPQEVVDFTAWVAVAVCDGMEAACGVRPRIKWTNDIDAGGGSCAASSQSWAWRVRAMP